MSSNDGLNEDIDLEFEALKAIYLEDITIESFTTSDPLRAHISVDIYPKTGHKTDDQFVRLTLVISVSKNYPNECPAFHLKNIRGLNEDRIQRIKSNIETIFVSKRGETMIYDFIESSRDLLTTFNCPVGHRCAICLYDFTTSDQILRNECFHHLHSRCFADYVVSTLGGSDHSINNNNQKIRVQCPVCRKDLKSTDFQSYIDPNLYDIPVLSTQPLKDESVIIEEAKLNVKKFNEIYEKQRKNGGIIDIENQKNKFFIRISETNINTESTEEMSIS